MTHSMIVVLRGTERYHMEDYLLLRGFHRETQEIFTTQDIRAVFQPTRKISLGLISITEVEVCFEGDPDKVTSEVARFRLQFLTAGG